VVIVVGWILIESSLLRDGAAAKGADEDWWGLMRTLRLGSCVLAIAVVGVFLTPPAGSGAGEILTARISPQRVTATEAPLLESIDVCNRSASSPQINTVVEGPDGEVVIDQYHLVGTTEPGVVVNTDGSWSVELRLRDDAGQPTGEPFPSLGTYTVHVDCVTTYTPQVRIPYNDLTFEVVASTTPTTPTEPPPGVAPVAVPVPADPDYSG
jgi:hypothetical protein